LTLLSTPAFALTVPAPTGPFSVVAGASIAIPIGVVRESFACRLAVGQSPPYWDGIYYRWDAGLDGVYESDWSAGTVFNWSAAGQQGPSVVNVRFEAQCYYFDLATFTFQPDFGYADFPVNILNAPPVLVDVVPIGHSANALPTNTPVSFDVTATDAEPGDTLSYVWTWADGPVGSGDPSTRTFTAPGNYQVNVRVSDGTDSVSRNFNFTVENERPDIRSVTIPQTVTEGDVVQLGVNAIDVDPLTYTWTIEPEMTTLTGAAPLWQPFADGRKVVTVDVSDGFSSESEHRNVDVLNAPPVITAITTDGPVYEGVTESLTLAVTDPGLDPIRVAWALDTVDVPFGPFGDLDTPFTAPDDGDYTIGAVARDDAGAEDAFSRVIPVLNVPPALVGAVVPTTAVDDATPFALSALASDVPADPLSYTWSLDDGSFWLGANVDAVFPAGTFVLTLTVDDGDGGLYEQSWSVTSVHAAPVIGAEQPDALDEGEVGAFSLITDDVVDVVWYFSDGFVARGYSVEHAFADEGVYTFSIVATDGVGAQSSLESGPIEVSNVAPTVAPLGLPPFSEGSPTLVTAFADDPGADTLTYAWSVNGVVVANTNPASLTLPDSGPYTVGVVVDDGDGGTDTTSVVVQSANIDPMVTLTGDRTDAVSQVLSWRAAVSDPGADTFTYDWDFGDGVTVEDGRDAVSHSYAANGTYTVTVTVHDDDGGVGTDTFDVTISSIGPGTPVLTLSDSDEGEAVELRCALAGPGVVTYTWAFGDGASASGPVASHAWVDDGEYDVTCTVTDAMGHAASSGGVVVVRNVAPVISGAPVLSVVAGDTFSFAPSATDPGALDLLSWTLSGPPSAQIVPQTGAVLWATGPQDVGTARFVVGVTDGDEGGDTLAFEVIVVLRDLDADGMEDFWETAVGLDPTDGGDALFDPDGDGRVNLAEYLGGTDPFSSDRPAPPVLDSPVGGEEIATAEVYLFATAPVYAFTYDLRLYADAGLTTVVAAWEDLPATDAIGDLGGGCGVLSAPLDENTGYWWTARVSDGFVDSAWADPEAFVVDAVAEAPGVPVLVEPRDGVTVGVSQPVLHWFGATDPEGDEVAYRLSIDVGVGFQTTVVQGPATDNTWQVPTSLPDGTELCWFVEAVDAGGLSSAASETWCFLVDLTNQPPSTPIILAPVDLSSVAENPATVEVGNGVDPEGRVTTHLFELDTVATFDSADHQSARVATEGDGTTSWTTAGLVEDTWYFVRVLASDGASDSPWATASFFVNALNDPPSAPVAVLPVSGDALAAGDELVVADAIDPEGGPLTYEFLVLSEAGVVVAQTAGVVETPDRTAWAPPALDPGTYTWQARATDEAREAGPWSVAAVFVVNGTVDPPPTNSRTVPEVTGDGVDLLLTGCGCATGSGAPMGGLLVALAWSLRRRRR